MRTALVVMILMLWTTCPAMAGDPGEPGGWWSADCPRDLTGDDVVDVEDLIAMVLNWGPCAGACFGDLTHDGVVDVEDLVELLLQWGPCGCAAGGQLLEYSSGTPWDPQAGYQLDSGVNLRLELECLDAQNVVFQVWSDGVFGAFTDWDPPFIYDADALTADEVPSGMGYLQALLRFDGETPFAVLEFPTFFVPSPPPIQPQCSDGIDNDGDGLVDFPDDPGCSSPTSGAEDAHDGGPGDTTPPAPGPEDGPEDCGNGWCDEGEDALTCPGDCGGSANATLLWLEDFEADDYGRWGWAYEDWSSCAVNGFASDKSVSPGHSHRSEITCQAAESHRGYGLLRFVGDTTVPNFFIPSSGGIDSPHGIVVSFWSWLDAPHGFSVPSGRWVSLMTVTDDCSNAWHQVITVNIDDRTGRLKPVHVDAVEYAAAAPAFPQRQWVRTTVYVNFYEQLMHVWQDGQPVAAATFTRPGLTACQFHFGLYASGANDDIVLYEDNIAIWKLTAPLTDLSVEPWGQ